MSAAQREQNRQKHGAAKAALLISACFLCVLAGLGLGKAETVPGVFLEDMPEGGGTVLLLSGNGAQAWVVCSGPDSSVLLKLNARDGTELLRRELDHPLAGAALRGTALFAWRDDHPAVELTEYSAASLEERSRRRQDCALSRTRWFVCGDRGELLTVPGNDPDLLEIRGTDGKTETRRFPSPISFLAAGEDGSAALFSGETLYLKEAGGSGFREIPGAGKPEVFLGKDRWIEKDGVVLRAENGKAVPLFRLPDREFAPLFYCLDGENCLILSENGTTLRRYGPDGSARGYLVTEEEIAAVCGCGAVTAGKRGFSYVPLVFSGTAEPTASPSPTPTPGVSPEGKYLIVPEGTTAAVLRELMKPETTEIRDSSGSLFLQGRLATGMTVNRWTVIVPGDCDGTGRVTGWDLRRAMELLLSPGEGEEHFRLAADLDEDGVITTRDLVLLSKRAVPGGTYPFVSE